jgi:hypothetical protein
MFQAEATDLAKILDFDASALDPIISLQKQAANPRKNPRIGCLALQYKIHWSIDFYLYFMNPRQPQ